MENRDIVADVMREVDSIIDRQRALGRVKDQLDDRKRNPHEEDFIYDEATNGQRVFREVVDGVVIEKTVLHRRGRHDKDIAGADLLFEIVGEKFVLIQFKRADQAGRVANDESQLDELISNCSNQCPPFHPNMLGVCGSWYCIIDGNDFRYMPACVAQGTFAGRRSCAASEFGKSLDRGEFISAFAKCFLGARIDEWPYWSPSQFALLVFARTSEYPLIIVRQRGHFPGAV